MRTEMVKGRAVSGRGGIGVMSANQHASLIETAEVGKMDRTWSPQ